MKIANLLNDPSLMNLRSKLQLDVKKISLMVIFFLIVVIYGDFRFLLKLQLNALKKLEPKIVNVKSDLDSFNKGLALMQEEKSKAFQERQLPAPVSKKAISAEQVYSLFQEISELANKNDVKIVLMRPSREAGMAKPDKATRAEKFTTFLIALDLICDYSGLVNFINDLENAETLLVVQNLKIAPQQTDFLKQKVDLVVKTYEKK